MGWQSLLRAQDDSLVPMASPITPPVRQALAASGEARVLITLEGAGALSPAPAHVREMQDGVFSRLPAGALQITHRYRMVPGLAGILRETGLSALEEDPAVVRVQLDAAGRGHLGQSVSAVQADLVHQLYGMTGNGVRVAVLDTGVDVDHPDLAGAIAAQHCFTDGDCVPGGSDEGTSAQDEHGHGTNVTGILASRGVVSHPGFAPGVEIVALRVLDENNWGWLSDWLAALDWILANQATLQVDLVNMSLGTLALYSGNCDGDWPLMASTIAALRAQDVALFTSSGNQGAASAMGSPACNAEAIAVGATYDGDLGRQPQSGTYREWFGGSWPDCYDAQGTLQTITCFTNSGPLLDLVGPGARITAPGLGGGLSTYVGTSQAAPTAAGIAALLRQARPDLSPAALEVALEGSGPLLVDPKNGLQFPSLNAWAALASVFPVAPEGITLTVPAVIIPGGAAAFTAEVWPITATRPLTYVWQATGQQTITRTNALPDTASFAWPLTGPQEVRVTAGNVAGRVTITRAVSVVPGIALYMPLAAKRAEP